VICDHCARSISKSIIDRHSRDAENAAENSVDVKRGKLVIRRKFQESKVVYVIRRHSVADLATGSCHGTVRFRKLGIRVFQIETVEGIQRRIKRMPGALLRRCPNMTSAKMMLPPPTA